MPENNTKLIAYIGMGINSLVIAALLHAGQIINSNNISVSRFEEKFNFLAEQGKTIETKLDNSISQTQQIDKRLAQVETRTENLGSTNKKRE